MLHVALALELGLQVAQRLEVAHRRGGQLAFERVDVDVVEARRARRLRQLRFERLQVGQVGDGADRVAHAERLVAVDVGRLPAAEHPGPQRPERVGELGHLQLEAHVLHRLLHELAQLGPLLARQRAHHPLGGRLTAGERVDELVDVLGVLGEEVAVLVHELGEVAGGVLATRVLLQQRVEVGHHLPHRLHGGGVLPAEGLLHPRELGVEHLLAEHVHDVLPVLLALGAAPLVVTELPHLPGRVVGQGVERHLGQTGVVALLAGEEVALGGQRPVELLAHLVERAAEVAPTLHLAPALGDLPAQLVETAAVAETLAHEPVDRLAQARTPP